MLGKPCKSAAAVTNGSVREDVSLFLNILVNSFLAPPRWGCALLVMVSSVVAGMKVKLGLRGISVCEEGGRRVVQISGVTGLLFEEWVGDRGNKPSSRLGSSTLVRALLLGSKVPGNGTVPQTSMGSRIARPRISKPLLANLATLASVPASTITLVMTL